MVAHSTCILCFEFAGLAHGKVLCSIHSWGFFILSFVILEPTCFPIASSVDSCIIGIGHAKLFIRKHLNVDAHTGAWEGVKQGGDEKATSTHKPGFRLPRGEG